MKTLELYTSLLVHGVIISYGVIHYFVCYKGPFELLYVSSKDEVNNLGSMAVITRKEN
jgi:hypothetical protein